MWRQIISYLLVQTICYSDTALLSEFASFVHPDDTLAILWWQHRHLLDIRNRISNKLIGFFKSEMGHISPIQPSNIVPLPKLSNKSSSPSFIEATFHFTVKSLYQRELRQKSKGTCLWFIFVNGCRPPL